MASIASEASNHVLTTLLATSNEAVDEENERYGHVLIQFLAFLDPSSAVVLLLLLRRLSSRILSRFPILSSSSSSYIDGSLRHSVCIIGTIRLSHMAGEWITARQRWEITTAESGREDVMCSFARETCCRIGSPAGHQ